MGGRPDLAVSVLCPQVSHVSGVGLHATGRENGVKRDPRSSCCQLACLVRSFCLFAGWLVLFCSVFRCAHRTLKRMRLPLHTWLGSWPGLCAARIRAALPECRGWSYVLLNVLLAVFYFIIHRSIVYIGV